jgi:ribosomal protein S18 acetylase RimI-like enzyme
MGWMAAMPTSKPGEIPHLRPLNIVHDLPAVADLVEKCFSDTMDAEGHRYIQQMRRAGQDNTFLRWATSAIDTVSMPLSGYVWEENKEIIGNVSLIPFRHDHRKFYLIANVAVRSDHRRKGIGKALTLAAMEHSRERRADETWLQVREDNPGAIELYRQLGFVEQMRRTNWQSRPDRNASIDGLNITITRHSSRDWQQAETWLRRSYPENTAWYQAIPWNIIRPGAGPALYRFFLETECKHWAARNGPELQAMLTWQAVYGSSDRLWAAVPPEGSALAFTALLLQARRILTWRQKLSLDFPAGVYAAAIEAAGFYPHRTLLWMRLETKVVEVRTLS